MTVAQASTVHAPCDQIEAQARAYAERGTALGGAGSVEDAQVALRIAVELARSCGAHTIANEALQALVANGGRAL
jgi:hypothetical protein